MNDALASSHSTTDERVRIRTQWGPFIERIGSEIAVHGRLIFSATKKTDLLLAVIVMEGDNELHRSLEPISICPARVHEFTTRFPANTSSETSLWAQVEIQSI